MAQKRDKKTTTSGTGLFGQIALKKGYITPDLLAECLQEQATLIEKGEPVMVGQVMLRKGYITLEQFLDILYSQAKYLLECPGCGKFYNAIGVKEGEKVYCKSCRTQLQPPQVQLSLVQIDKLEIEEIDLTRLKPGFIIGKYEVLAEIGHGGMGIVYSALDLELNRKVALKVLRPDLPVSIFYKEARTVAALNHPNIVKIFDTGEFADISYIVMEYIEGESLDSYAEKQDVNTRVRIVKQIADAIHYAHENGIIHRDIKPSNILVTRDGRPIITDFGLAKIIGTESLLTRAGAILGTPAYISPEQIKSPRDVDRRSDVYSLGIVLYQILSGKLPFDADTSVKLYHLIIEVEPPSLSRVARGLPRELAIICHKAIAKDPPHRYQTMKEFADDIERYLTGEPILARPPSLFYKISKRIRKNPAVTAAICIAIICLIIGAIALLQTIKAHYHAQKIEKEKKVISILSRIEKWEENLYKPEIELSKTFQSLQEDINSLEKLKKELPAYSPLYYALAKGYLFVEQYTQADYYIAQASQIDPLEWKYKLLQIQIYLEQIRDIDLMLHYACNSSILTQDKQNLLKKLAVAAEESLKFAPPEKHSAWVEAIWLSTRADYQNALQKALKAEEIASEVVVDCYILLDEYKNAISYLQKLIEVKKSSHRLYNRLGNAYLSYYFFNKQRGIDSGALLENAIKAFNRSLEIKPEEKLSLHACAYANLALAKTKLLIQEDIKKELETSFDYYHKLINKDKNDFDALYGYLYTLIYLAGYNFSQGISPEEWLNKIPERINIPGQSTFLLNALFYDFLSKYKQDQKEEYSKLFRQNMEKLKEADQETTCWIELAQMSCWFGLYQEALERLSVAASKSPNNLTIPIIQATIIASMMKNSPDPQQLFNMAKEKLESVLAKNNKYFHALRQLANTYYTMWKLGEKFAPEQEQFLQKAIEKLQEAISIYPDDPHTLYRYGLACLDLWENSSKEEEEVKILFKAVEYLERASQTNPDNTEIAMELVRGYIEVMQWKILKEKDPLEEIQKAQEISRRILKSIPQHQKNRLYWATILLNQSIYKYGKEQAYQEELNQSITLLEELIRENPELVDAYTVLSRCYEFCAGIALKKGNDPQEHINKSLKVLDSAKVAGPDVVKVLERKIYATAIIIRWKLINDIQADEQINDIINWCTEIIEINKQNIEAYLIRSAYHLSLARSRLKKEEQWEQSKKYYEKSIDDLKMALNVTKSPDRILSDMIHIYIELARVKIIKFENPLEELENVLAYNQQRFEKDPRNSQGIFDRGLVNLLIAKWKLTSFQDPRLEAKKAITDFEALKDDPSFAGSQALLSKTWLAYLRLAIGQILCQEDPPSSLQKAIEYFRKGGDQTLEFLPFSQNLLEWFNKKDKLWKEHLKTAHHAITAGNEKTYYVCALFLYEKGLSEFEKLPEKQKKNLTKQEKETVYVSYYNLACCYAMKFRLDKQEETKQKALDALEHSVKYGWRDHQHTLEDKDLETLREDERFKQIIEKMKAL